jgi:hypothetical protein
MRFASPTESERAFVTVRSTIGDEQDADGFGICILSPRLRRYADDRKHGEAVAPPPAGRAILTSPKRSPALGWAGRSLLRGMRSCHGPAPGLRHRAIASGAAGLPDGSSGVSLASASTLLAP